MFLCKAAFNDFLFIDVRAGRHNGYVSFLLFPKFYVSTSFQNTHVTLYACEDAPEYMSLQFFEYMCFSPFEYVAPRNTHTSNDIPFNDISQAEKKTGLNDPAVVSQVKGNGPK